MKWVIELFGDPFNLEDARNLFETGKVRIETFEGFRTVLAADEFEGLVDVIDVRDAAKNMVDLINGALFLHDQDRKPLQQGSVWQYKDSKWHQLSIFTPEPIQLRVRSRAPFVSIDGVTAPRALPPERAWFDLGLSDDVVADVFNYLRAKPDWFELYKAFERMRDDINHQLGGQHKQEQMGWPTKGDLDKFTESATVHRHSPAKWGRLNPATAMKLEDATLFIVRLAQIWLKWRQGP
jgi:hypothetical protein